MPPSYLSLLLRDVLCFLLSGVLGLSKSVEGEVPLSEGGVLNSSSSGGVTSTLFNSGCAGACGVTGTVFGVAGTPFGSADFFRGVSSTNDFCEPV